MKTASLVLIITLFAGLAVVLAQNDALRTKMAADRAELTRALVALELASQAAEVHRAHLKRQADADAAWRALVDDLTHQEGANAPLSDYLRDGAGRVLDACPAGIARDLC